MQLDLTGVGVALVTPFNNNDDVDYTGLENLVNYVIDGGVQFLVVHGTTGETPTLTTEEKKETLAFIKRVNNGRLPIVLGHGGNNTRALIDGLNAVDLEGVSALLCASPHYNKPNQEGIFQHYKALNDASPLPIVVYNVPGRTASNILPETQVRMARELDKIIAVKEASGDIEQKAKIIQQKPSDFQVLSGDDAQVVAECALGSVGVISVIANALPREFSEMVKACHVNDYPKARKIFYRVRNVIDWLFADGNPAGIKAALTILGVCGDHIRLPLVKANDHVYKALQEELKPFQNNG